MSQPSLFEESSITFDSRFMQEHAGHIITNPKIAIVELVSNAYDAGATRVEITWPAGQDQPFGIADNGSGMTVDEFNRRWRRLNYNRLSELGEMVAFPTGVTVGLRRALGQNGKGRHGALCFCDSYTVETVKDGTLAVWQVSLTSGGREPFSCEMIRQDSQEGNGTKITGVIQQNWIPVSDVCECIGSKFLVDPSFKVFVNDEELQLTDLQSISISVVDIPPYGSVKVHRVNAPLHDRTGRLHGVTWWVYGRMVGLPSWEGLEEFGLPVDGRTSMARRNSFVIEADILKEDIEPDWSAFRNTERVKEARHSVNLSIATILGEQQESVRHARKQRILTEKREHIQALPRMSKQVIAGFIDEILQKCPSIKHSDLENVIDILVNLERSRNGYELLTRLSENTPSGLDTWTNLMRQWSAISAEIILSELGRRITLLDRLYEKVNIATTDELHELQPLFAHGLWMFGTEYEDIAFTSNRQMVTVLRKLFGDNNSTGTRLRPDFVVLPDSTLGIYSADGYENGEVGKVSKVLVVELKRGGYEVSLKERTQGEKYARELRKSGLVPDTAPIEVFVLGSQIDSEYSGDYIISDKSIIVRPTPYDLILRRAQARIFHLQRSLEQRGELPALDPDLVSALEEPTPGLFPASSAS